MITAEQANKLSGPKTEDMLEFIEERIKLQAVLGGHEVIIRENPYSCWLYGETDNLHKNELEVLEILKKNGFTVDLYYRESQFVDIGLHIKW